MSDVSLTWALDMYVTFYRRHKIIKTILIKDDICNVSDLDNTMLRLKLNRSVLNDYLRKGFVLE